MSPAPQSQASQATQAAEAPSSPQLKLVLTLDEVNLILEAVGALPFARVYALVGRIQQQAAQQLQAADAPPAA
ncbi:MAG: hypothetical protein KBC73_06280 [Burkholderiaceae bacterium]|nr:hypothetical protein [Burkholderiaceae bacterium]